MNFLYKIKNTLTLISSWRAMMCLAKNSQVLNFLSHNWHFQIYLIASFESF